MQAWQVAYDRNGFPEHGLVIGIRDAESVADSDAAVGWAIARLNLKTAVDRFSP
jgi:hypothetical protein